MTYRVRSGSRQRSPFYKVGQKLTYIDEKLHAVGRQGRTVRTTFTVREHTGEGIRFIECDGLFSPEFFTPA